MPKINRPVWLALWAQDRRRARAARRQVPQGNPPPPVLTLFEVIDNNGQIDVNVTWTWTAQGWPDTGTFVIQLECDDSYNQGGGRMPLASAPAVAGALRSYSFQNLGLAEDKGYYCRMKYQVNGQSSAFTDWLFGNPY